MFFLYLVCKSLILKHVKDFSFFQPFIMSNCTNCTNLALNGQSPFLQHERNALKMTDNPIRGQWTFVPSNDDGVFQNLISAVLLKHQGRHSDSTRARSNPVWKYKVWVFLWVQSSDICKKYKVQNSLKFNFPDFGLCSTHSWPNYVQSSGFLENSSGFEFLNFWFRPTLNSIDGGPA